MKATTAYNSLVMSLQQTLNASEKGSYHIHKLYNKRISLARRVNFAVDKIISPIIYDYMGLL
jgi:hypothetical protein